MVPEHLCVSDNIFIEQHKPVKVKQQIVRIDLLNFHKL